MQIYGDGRLIHQAVSDDGLIEVVDSGNTRSLHFGTFPRQSSMRLNQPHYLELSYTQAMMGCLLLNPNPQRVLVIGLGGGSLVKFLLHHFPDCYVDVVEYRQDVVEVAQSFFQVPVNNPNLNINLGDGYLYVNQCFYQTDFSYDLILVDAYDQNGMAASVGVQAFFDACSGILTDNGVLSINLWGSERALFNSTMERINESFQQRAMILPVENKGNVIALASKFNVENAYLKKLRQQVNSLEMVYQINLPRSLQNLIRQNRNFIHRLFAI
jgi:spermidine synthase